MALSHVRQTGRAGDGTQEPWVQGARVTFQFYHFSDFPLVVTSIRLEGFMTCVYFRTGNPKGLTQSGSGELGIIVCDRVPWLYQYRPGVFMLLLVLCPGTPGGSTGNGSGFIASRGKWLEVSPDRLGELGIDDTSKRF